MHSALIGATVLLEKEFPYDREALVERGELVPRSMVAKAPEAKLSE
jgi:hypothetical protein